MTRYETPRAAAVVLALLLAGLWTGGCGGGGTGAAEEHPEHSDEEAASHDEHDDHEAGEPTVIELEPEAVERTGLETEPAALRDLRARRVTTGRLGFDEDRLAHVAPRIPGRLVRVPATLGARVAAGDPLAVVDSVELGEAKAAFLRARAHHEVAREAFERARSLHEDHIVSEQEVLEAEGAAREAAADLAAAREALRLVGLGDDEIRRLDWNEPEASHVAVRAPFAGTVVAKEAALGELVTPERTLFTLADLSEVWVWVDLYERDLAHVRRGERVEVRLDAFPGEALTGELAYLASELDPGSRTMRARVDLPNPDRRLKPGMFARVTLEAAGEHGGAPVLAIPRDAVQRDDGGPLVFVKTAPTRFERREVELGRETDEHVEVLAGLTPGEQVVTRGAFLLKSQASADQLGGHHH